MSRIATYSCTALNGTNKTGELKPNADGYYTLCVGAVNSYNSAGAFYPEEPALELFNESSAFQRRIKDGALYAELGHPRKLPSMSNRDYMARCMDILETNIVAHFRRVWLERGTMRDPQGRPVVAIMAEVRPYGPMGHVLKEGLENRSQNVCFSIRSFTHDVVQGGIINKLLRMIVTFDMVVEPGISIAKKWYAPALESHSEMTVLPPMLEDMIRFQKAAGSGFENSTRIALDVQDALSWGRQPVIQTASNRPPSARW